jgi:hypothetical protein
MSSASRASKTSPYRTRRGQLGAADNVEIAADSGEQLDIAPCDGCNQTTVQRRRRPRPRLPGLRRVQSGSRP